jgi:hypothetical protein
VVNGVDDANDAVATRDPPHRGAAELRHPAAAVAVAHDERPAELRRRTARHDPRERLEVEDVARPSGKRDDLTAARLRRGEQLPNVREVAGLAGAPARVHETQRLLGGRCLRPVALDAGRVDG